MFERHLAAFRGQAAVVDAALSGCNSSDVFKRNKTVKLK